MENYSFKYLNVKDHLLFYYHVNIIKLKVLRVKLCNGENLVKIILFK
jgi:hypothetical protein